MWELHVGLIIDPLSYMPALGDILDNFNTNE
jgi:hypothetical protein